MTVKELNRDQLIQVKQHYYTVKQDQAGESVSYGELADIDTIVPDDEIFTAYADTDFTEGDFEQ